MSSASEAGLAWRICKAAWLGSEARCIAVLVLTG